MRAKNQCSTDYANPNNYEDFQETGPSAVMKYNILNDLVL